MTQRVTLDLHVDTQQGGRHGNPTTVLYLAPVTLISQSVEYLPIEPYLLMEEVGGSNQLMTSK